MRQQEMQFQEHMVFVHLRKMVGMTITVRRRPAVCFQQRQCLEDFLFGEQNVQIAFGAQSTCRIDAPRQISSFDWTEPDAVGTEQLRQFAEDRLLLHIAKRVSQPEFADVFRSICRDLLRYPIGGEVLKR